LYLIRPSELTDVTPREIAHGSWETMSYLTVVLYNFGLSSAFCMVFHYLFLCGMVRSASGLCYGN